MDATYEGNIEMDENPPDFSRRDSRFDWSVNMPTLIAAATMAIAGIVAYGNFAVDRNDVKWSIKELQRESEDARKDRDDLHASLKTLSEAQVQTNKDQSHTQQTLDWILKNPYQAQK